MDEGLESGKLHVIFLPYLTPSHMIPLVDTARLFAAHNAKVTIITTPYNAALFQSSITANIQLGHQISIHTLQFPAAELGLPEGIENLSAAPSMDMLSKVYQAISLLQKPMEKAILDISPHCIFADTFYPWTVDVAEKLKIPRFTFYAMSFLVHCVRYNLELYAPHEKVSSDSDNFLIPGLPDKIEMKRSQLENYEHPELLFFKEEMRKAKESEDRSYGMVLDTVYELEPEYADYYKKISGKKCWSIGPLFHFTSRGKAEAADHKHYCLDWLDAQEDNKVLFICFGSIVKFPDAQLLEIALALDASNQSFIWVVRNEDMTRDDEQENWLPYGFEQRMRKSNKGLTIRGWAPQLKILSHRAVGGFMTHCGWNSILEAITAGVPLITWPLFSEQFYNEKLVEVLQVGVRVGADYWNAAPNARGPLVGSKQIEEAINRLICDSEESRKIRQRAKEAAAMATRAAEEGGSSNQNLVALIEEIKLCASGSNN